MTLRTLVVGTCMALALPSVNAVTAQTTPAPPSTAPAGAAPSSANTESGKLAWYGRRFAGRRTASGERFNPAALTMAHKTLPFGTRVRVTNTANNRSVVLRVNDRGPTQADRVGDVSRAAAERLQMVRAGVIDARIEVLSSR